MENSNYMAVLVTLSDEQRGRAGQEPSQRAVRAEVWSTAAKRLQQTLGERYSRFMPAARPWELSELPPYGVLLGAAEPLEFISCFLRAGTEQRNEMDRWERVIREKSLMTLKAPSVEGFSVTAVAIPGNDPEAAKLLEMNHRFLRGDIAAGAGIYYLERNANFMESAYDRQVLANVGRYALCVAELTPATEV